MATQSPSMNPIKSEGLPDLPYLASRESYATHEVVSYARAHGLACYEAGRASHAAPIPSVDAVALNLLREAVETIDTLPGYPKGADLCDRIEAYLAAPVASRAQTEPLMWIDGEPPFPQNQEWFIAETTYGDRVVLMALPKEYSYDYKTADQTYMKATTIKRWMQFPDCEYLPPATPGEDEMSSAFNIPESFVLVPREPTLAMKRAGLAERNDDLSASIYKAMIAAAPTPTQVAEAPKAVPQAVVGEARE